MKGIKHEMKNISHCCFQESDVQDCFKGHVHLIPLKLLQILK